MISAVSGRIVWLSLIASVASACAAAPPPKPEAPPYQPRFTYASKQAAEKADVTIAVVSPTLSPLTSGFWTLALRDPNTPAKDMISAIGGSFAELLVAKGFGTRGPFDSLDSMTFPDKKGSDMLLYAEFDVQPKIELTNVHAEDFGNPITGSHMVQVCDASVSFQGNVQLVIKEPLSGEKLWVKRIEVSTPRTSHPGQQGCQDANIAVTPDFRDASRKSFEEGYLAIMSGLDKFVNADEFVSLKKQAADLRAKKVY